MNSLEKWYLINERPDGSLPPYPGEELNQKPRLPECRPAFEMHPDLVHARYRKALRANGITYRPSKSGCIVVTDSRLRPFTLHFFACGRVRLTFIMELNLYWETTAHTFAEFLDFSGRNKLFYPRESVLFKTAKP